MPKLVRPIRVDERVYHLTLEPDTNGVLIVGCRELPGCRRPPRIRRGFVGRTPPSKRTSTATPFSNHSANLPNVQAIGEVAPVGTGVPTI
jgi:hypothetical protein